MSGNGGNPHSLRDLLGTYEKSGLAALKILKTISSHREFIEVLKRMGGHGGKGDFNDLRTNYAQLMFQRLFKSQQSGEAEEWLRSVYG